MQAITPSHRVVLADLSLRAAGGRVLVRGLEPDRASAQLATALRRADVLALLAPEPATGPLPAPEATAHQGIVACDPETGPVAPADMIAQLRRLDRRSARQATVGSFGDAEQTRSVLEPAVLECDMLVGALARVLGVRA